MKYIGRRTICVIVSIRDQNTAMISKMDNSVLKRPVSLDRLKMFQQRSEDIVTFKGITLSISTLNVKMLLEGDCHDLNVLQGW
ncbi:hypothetical protein HK096_000354, partial [Nowakowskiella sp. JEL0078]